MLGGLERKHGGQDSTQTDIVEMFPVRAVMLLIAAKVLLKIT